jgi:hypothetical protein
VPLATSSSSSGVVVGLRPLAEAAEVVTRERVQLEHVGEPFELLGQRLPDVEPEMLAACEPGLNVGLVDPLGGGPIGVHKRPRHACSFARGAGDRAFSPSARS